DAQEETGIRLDQRVGGVADVEVEPSVVGVDGSLHGIAHVVAYLVIRLGIRVHRGGGVGVQHPVKGAVLGDDQVGIGVVGQERSEARRAFEHSPVNHQVALGVDIDRSQDVLL